MRAQDLSTAGIDDASPFLGPGTALPCPCQVGLHVVLHCLRYEGMAESESFEASRCLWLPGHAGQYVDLMGIGLDYLYHLVLTTPLIDRDAIRNPSFRP